MAYVGVHAWDWCNIIGPKTPLSGVLEVPATQLSTWIYRPQPEWGGSKLDLAKFMAAGKTNWNESRRPYHGNLSEWRLDPEDDRPNVDDVHQMSWYLSSRSLNVADLQGPVPAVNYYMGQGQNKLRCTDCSTITEGIYNYNFLMPEIFLDLDPAWRTCIPEGFVIDPPMILSTTRRPSLSAPAWAQPAVSRITAQAQSGFTTRPKPGQTVSAPTATPTAGLTAPSQTNLASFRAPQESFFDVIEADVEAVRRIGLLGDLKSDGLAPTLPDQRDDISGQAMRQHVHPDEPEEPSDPESSLRVAVASALESSIPTQDQAPNGPSGQHPPTHEEVSSDMDPAHLYFENADPTYRGSKSHLGTDPDPEYISLSDAPAWSSTIRSQGSVVPLNPVNIKKSEAVSVRQIGVYQWFIFLCGWGLIWRV